MNGQQTWIHTAESDVQKLKVTIEANERIIKELKDRNSNQDIEIQKYQHEGREQIF